MRVPRAVGSVPVAELARRALLRSEWDELERLVRLLVPHLAGEVAAARVAAERQEAG